MEKREKLAVTDCREVGAGNCNCEPKLAVASQVLVRV
jgi:hypothetical protein